MTNLDNLKHVYAENLKLAHSKYPDEYFWPIEEMPEVIKRMSVAIDKLSFNKNSKAWSMTCKQLGIKHTYKAIEDYIKQVSRIEVFQND